MVQTVTSDLPHEGTLRRRGNGEAVDDSELTALVRAAQAGDAGSRDELLVRLRPHVLARCSRFLPHPQDAEEAAQDALLAVSTHLGEYAGRGSVTGWVTVIASNCARSTYRSLRRHAHESGPRRPARRRPRARRA